MQVTDNAVGSNNRISGNDVAANGDVAWWDSDSVWRYRDGVSTKLSPVPADNTQPAFWPRTDGTNVVWSTWTSCCQDTTPRYFGKLVGYGSGPFTINEFEQLEPDAQLIADNDYRTAGGWVAFISTGRPFSSNVLLTRDPSGTETAVGPTADELRILGLAEDGQVISKIPNGIPSSLLYLSKPGSEPLRLGSLPSFFENPGRGYGDHVLHAGDRWYAVVGGSLLRLSLGDLPTAGSETTIGPPVPHGDAAPADASFRFSSTVPNAAFQCRLDGGAWRSCSSPTSYPRLRHGPHRFLVRTVEPGGGVDPEPASQAWSVERTPPAPFALVAPARGARIADRTPTLSWEAARDAGSGIDHYVVWLDGERVATDVHATQLTLRKPLAAGGHRWHVVAVDRAANVRASALRRFRVVVSR